MTERDRQSSVRESIDSKFRYVLLVAERAEQLMRGARAKLDMAAARPRVSRKRRDRPRRRSSGATARRRSRSWRPCLEEEAEVEAAEAAEAGAEEEAEVH